MSHAVATGHQRYEWGAIADAAAAKDSGVQLSVEQRYFLYTLDKIDRSDGKLKDVQEKLSDNIEQTKLYNAVMKAAALIEKEMPADGSKTLNDLVLRNPGLLVEFNNAL